MLVNAPADSSAPDRGRLGRVVAWTLFALALGVGVFLYFRHAPDVTPLLSTPGAQ